MLLPFCSLSSLLFDSKMRPLSHQMALSHFFPHRVDPKLTVERHILFSLHNPVYKPELAGKN